MPTGIYPRESLVGKTYNRLTVIAKSHMRNNCSYWKSRCVCGKVVVVIGSSLKNGNTKSCGCLNRELSAKKLILANTTHGSSKTRLYKTWKGIRERCYSLGHTSYKDYGRRGVRVCKEWHKFETFKKWATQNGYRNNLTIDRKNPFGNYEPGNCRWITRSKQGRTKRNSIYVIYKGKRLHLKEWSDKLGVKYHTLYQRYEINKRPEYILRTLRQPKGDPK